MDGLLIVDKPAGVTSAEVVRRIKRGLRCKTGHLGTLDPFATGVLPLCLGEATKIAQFLNQADKGYSGRIRLGRATDTGDCEGQEVASAAVAACDDAALDRLAASFVGARQQTPPMFSAIKRAGTPLYKLARQGIAVDREPRSIEIETLTLSWADPTAIDLEVKCSKGTYIRVLAQDIAQALGTVGHLESLRRTSFGPFEIGDAATIEAIEGGTVRVIALRQALRQLREIELDAEQARRARQGFVPMLERLQPAAVGEMAKLIAPDGALAAVIMYDSDGWQYVRVFGAPSTAA